MPEELVTETAEPGGEESQVASRRRSCAISCADRDTMEEVEVETPADEEQSSPCAELANGVDVGRQSPGVEFGRRVAEERPT